MYTVRQYNDLRVDWMTRKTQKDALKRMWGEKFVKFLPCDDRRYISYLVRV